MSLSCHLPQRQCFCSVNVSPPVQKNHDPPVKRRAMPFGNHFVTFFFNLTPPRCRRAPRAFDLVIRVSVSYDKSMLSRSSPSLSPTELSPELGGLDSSLMFGDVADRALAGEGPRILARHVWMLGRSPPSTCTSPTSLPLPMIVPRYFESSPVLLCFFFRTVRHR